MSPRAGAGPGPARSAEGGPARAVYTSPQAPFKSPERTHTHRSPPLPPSPPSPPMQGCHGNFSKFSPGCRPRGHTPRACLDFSIAYSFRNLKKIHINVISNHKLIHMNMVCCLREICMFHQLYNVYDYGKTLNLFSNLI